MGPIEEAEQLLTARGEQWTAPEERECLYHYLCRMLDAFGCRGHRFTERWARGREVRGRPVLQWARETGGCCCDCEVIMNSFGRRSTRRRGLLCPEALQQLQAQDRETW